MHLPEKQVHFCTTRVCKPGSVIDSHLSKPEIARRLQPPPRSGRANHILLHGVAPDRVYIVKPMSPWAGWALTPPFHPYLTAVSLCCTCPGVTPGGRYPLSLPFGARTFLTWGLSAPSRGCPTRSRKYCNPNMPDCQTSCKFFCERVYYR